MDVDVDEPGCDDATAGLDHLRGRLRAGREIADGRDPIADDPHVGRERGRPRPVDDGPAADHQVECRRHEQ